MAILKIAQLGNPILRRRAADVPVEAIPSAETQRLIDDMIETMRDHNGAGLAAPQVHESTRIVVFETQDNARYPEAPDIPLTVAINPEITVLTDETDGMWEGCLSVSGLRGFVERPNRVHFTAYDRDGVRFSRELKGFEAIVVQHECDHVDGVLFVDRIADTKKLAFMTEYLRFHDPSS